MYKLFGLLHKEASYTVGQLFAKMTISTSITDGPFTLSCINQDVRNERARHFEKSLKNTHL